MRRCLLPLLAVFLAVAPAARGFTLLDFREQADVLIRRLFAWADPRTTVLYCPNGRGLPFALTYRIDANFMSDEPPAVRAAAGDAVRAAFATWTNATNGLVSFVERPWSAVTNCDSSTNVPGCPQPCSVTRVAFEGPPMAEWQACTTGSPNFCAPACWPEIPCPIYPGWGANIDVFTRPNGFVLCSNGFRYEMTPSVLGFTAVHRAGGDKILSIDIYLNQSYAWSADGSAARLPIGLPMPRCGTGSGAGAAALPADDDEVWEVVAGSTLFDIETVVLHELGHALGLDHPNEACAQGAAQINPWTYAFDPCGAFDPSAVMAGVYAGIKRELTDDDIGGVSFLYRSSLWGDLDSDGELSILDVVRTLDFAGHAAAPSPYEVNLLDFRQRNGRVDADEAVQMVQWLFEGEHPRGDRKALVARGSEGPIVGVASGVGPTIAIDALNDPSDIGLAPEFNLIVRIANPGAVAVSAWDVDIVYDPSIFANPRVSNGSFLPGGAWVSSGPDDGNIRFSKFGLGTTDSAVAGTLGIVTFDVVPGAVASSPSVVMFDFTDVQVVASQPFIHNFGTVPELNETLIVTDPSVMSYLYDTDGNGVLNAEDLYTFFRTPTDTNKNGSITDYDRRLVQEAARAPEPEDVQAGR